MAKFEFDISRLYEKAFGIDRGKPFDAEKANDRGILIPEGFEAPDFSTEEGTEFLEMRNQIAASNAIGQQIFLPCRLGGLLLPNEPSITISGRKNIEATRLSGSTRKGSIKELISVDDYQVRIRGVAINFKSKKVYPEDQVKALRDLYERNEALEVECALTQLLGIYRLVITDINLPEMIGVQHAQAYELTCLSDEDFILEI